MASSRLSPFSRSRPRVRALVLAAGLGTRLRPLTERVPKPLLPVAGAPLAHHTLDRLIAAGCEAAALNLHYKSSAIRQALGDEYRGLPLTYSEEQPERLGTLGAFAPLRDFFAEADVALVVNGDSLCRWPLKALLRRHLAAKKEGKNPRATLLVTLRASPERFGGGVGLDADGRVTSFRTGGPEAPLRSAAAGPASGAGPTQVRRVFAGAHAIDPTLLAGVEEKPADTVRDLYEPLLEEGELIQAVESCRTWHDLGTPRRYVEGLVDWVQGPVVRTVWPWGRSWKSPTARVGSGTRLVRSVVEEGAVVGEDCVLEDCVVMPGAKIGPRARLSRALVDFGAEVPAGAHVHARLMTGVEIGRAPRERDSVVGGLIYRPL